MLGMDQQLADLSDKELESLHANAVRLAQSGAPTWRQQAESLLPAIGAELERRSGARLQAESKVRRAKTRGQALLHKGMKEVDDELD